MLEYILFAHLFLFLNQAKQEYVNKQSKLTTGFILWGDLVS